MMAPATHPRRVQGLANANKCDSDGADGSPRAACGEGQHSANNASSEQEHSWLQNHHAVVNEGRNDACQKPSARQSTYQQQDENGLCGGADAVGDGVSHLGPFGAACHAQSACEQSGKQQGDLLDP